MSVVTITSGSRGGTGKTTVLLNIALLHAYVSYVKEGRYVLIFDAEVQEGTATYRLSPKLALSYREGKVKSVVDYILGRADLKDVVKVAIFRPEDSIAFPALITSAMTTPAKYQELEDLSPSDILDRLEALLKELAALLPLERVYVDMPATRIHENFSISLLALSDIVIPVGTPDPTSLLTLYTTITALRDYVKPPPIIDIAVVNRLTLENAVEPNTGRRYTDLYRKLLGVRFVVGIPDDPNLSASGAAGMIEVLSDKLKKEKSIRRLKKLASYVIECKTRHVTRRIVNLEHMHRFLSLGYKNDKEAETILLALYRARRRMPLE
ncbi:MAG: hypothetical protein J7L11_04605 [Thermoprotei archaeon]|nr:hypothetical protein [Thermoprotei archaeon]